MISLIGGGGLKFDGLPREVVDKVRQRRLKELLETYIKFPFHAAEYLMVNEIIDLRDTRPTLIKRLEFLANKDSIV